MKKVIFVTVTMILIIILLIWILYAFQYKSIDSYIAELNEDKLVKDNTTFYTLDNVINKFLATLVVDEIKDAYPMMSFKYKLNNDKKTFEKNILAFKNVILANGGDNSIIMLGEKIGKSEGILKKLYRYSDSIYIGELVNEISDNKYYIAVELNNIEKTFTILGFKESKAGDTNEK